MIVPSLPTRLDGAGPAVETHSLRKRYETGSVALAGLDLQVPAGAVYVLAGPNGAGKTTAFRVLLDLVRADQGEARVLGIRTSDDPALVRAQVGYVPEVVDTAYGWLSAEAFLHHHSAFFGAWDRRYAARLCARLKVPLRERMRGLSKGAARAVALVSALAHRPPVLLLDEPTDGLDPLAREELSAVLVDHMTHSPTTLLWSTHHVHEASRMADHLGVMREGRLSLQAPVDEVRLRLRRYRVQLPAGWTGAPDAAGVVLHREDSRREAALTVWGEEREVAVWLAATGAVVRDAAPLSLEEATLALLRGRRAA